MRDMVSGERKGGVGIEKRRRLEMPFGEIDSSSVEKGTRQVEKS